MPELPEVEITMRKLAPLIRGRKIVSFVSDWPRGLRAKYDSKRVERDISGRKIKKLSRIGKVLFVHLSVLGRDLKLRKLGFHQRMSGRMAVLDIGELKLLNKHARVKIGLDNGKILVLLDPRKFGVVWYGSDSELNNDKYLNTLGVDALNVSWKEFNRRLSEGKGVIKPFLLKQTIFAGIGNIVADEMLWFAGVHPQKKINSLTLIQRRALFLALKKVLNRSISMGGSSMRDWLHPDQSRGGYQDNWRVYGRVGKKCYRCRHTLKRAVVGGRGTTFCPFCQKI